MWLVMLGVAFVLGGLGFFGWDAYAWLQAGVWEANDGWWVFRETETTPNWLIAPESWFGLHRVASAVVDWPLFITLPTLGSAMVWIGSNLDEKQSLRREEGRLAAMVKEAKDAIAARPAKN